MADDQQISLMGALKIKALDLNPRRWVGASIVVCLTSAIGWWTDGLGGAGVGACIGVAVLSIARDACIGSYSDR